MEFRELGSTSEKISTIGMGTWRFGVYNGVEEKSREVAALRKGLELGISLIDTAEIYAGGRSEEVVGEAVDGKRDDVFIATKVSPDHLRHDAVIDACEGSLQRLGTSYIDLYQIHWPNPNVPIRETVGAMEKLVQDGKVRYIGVSNFSVEQMRETREALARNDIVSNQVEYSLRNRYAEADILPYCEKEKVSLIAYSPLAHGDIPETLQQKFGMTPAQLMLNWVTRNDCVLAIPKSSDFKHLEENASAVSTRLTADKYELISRTKI